MLTINLVDMRGGWLAAAREFFWECLPEFAFPETPEAQDGRRRDVVCYVPGSPNAAAEIPDAAGKDVASNVSTDNSFSPGEFFSALLKQLYIGQPYVRRELYVPVDFEDREALEDLLSEQIVGGNARAALVHILVPQRCAKRALIDLAVNNAKQSYDQRFRVLKPNAKAIQEELQEVLSLPELPKRVSCVDLSHLPRAETVASMVVWEDRKMKKSDYRT